jgi:hypothetical protein
MTLKDFTDQDLLNELEARKKKRLETEPPQPLGVQDGTALTSLVEKYVQDVWEKGYRADEDWPHYIYEVAVEAVFGKDIFVRINRRCNSLSKRSPT